MNIIINGMQWGDEGKGKIIDFLSNFIDLNIRINGGHNAGHIIYNNNIKQKIRILPSGIFKKYCLCFISNSVVFSLTNFVNEIKNINNNFYVSNLCIICNKIDEIIDFLLDKKINIGTTFSGINIVNVKKIIRISIKIFDINNILIIKKIKKNILFYNFFLFFFKMKIKIKLFFFLNKINFYFKNIKKKILNNEFFVNNNYNKIFEISQGNLLDINYGFAEFVTTSYTINKSIYLNSNFYLNKLKYFGITKSYSTRIGNGILNTCFKNKKKIVFSLLNGEIGTNSNRIRNSGWLDLSLLYNSIKINNISSLILTKMDTLLFFKKIKVNIYNFIKKNVTENYFNFNNYNNIFLNLKSWNHVNKNYIKNEKNFHNYIRLIEKFLNTKIIIISIGKLENDLVLL